MYLLEVAPLTSIPRPNPQILTYFTSQKVSVGSLVMVPLFKRQVSAIALKIKKVSRQKMQIKQADYLMRSVISIINKQPVLSLIQIKLALWISNYYWSSLGKVLKSMLPNLKYLTGNNLLLSPRREKKKEIKPILIFEKNCQLNPEKYLKAVQSTLNNQQSTIILVPEIRQIKTWQKMLQFDKKLVILHSKLTPKQYFNNWLKISQNKSKIILGTRLAILAPATDLGLIIVNQEHSPYYKSFDQKPYLQARDLALKLAQLAGVKTVLSSATPSVESYWQTAKTPPSKREKIDWRVYTEIIDLRQEIKAENFLMLSRRLQQSLKQKLQQKKQALLFINRKGLASALLCRDCGQTVNCPNCALPLVYHFSQSSQLICHHCGHQAPGLSKCPHCQSHWLKYLGGGSQKLLLQTQQIFPKAKISRLDKDSAPKLKNEKEILKAWLNKEIDILISTVLIFNLEPKFKADFIGLVNIDRQLHLPDFRSSERTWQMLKRLQCLLTLPSPRPDPDEDDNFLIQTYNPQNYVIEAIAKNNNQLFYQKEIKARARLFYPPFSHLIKLTIKHRNENSAQEQAQILKAKLSYAIQKVTDKIKILGPAPGFISKIKKQFIWQIILKVHPLLMPKLPQLLGIIPKEWYIDIDPETLL